jgi:hypothetical protein
MPNVMVRQIQVVVAHLRRQYRRGFAGTMPAQEDESAAG